MTVRSVADRTARSRTRLRGAERGKASRELIRRRPDRCRRAGRSTSRAPAWFRSAGIVARPEPRTDRARRVASVATNHASPSCSAIAQTSAIVAQSRSRANHAGSPNEKSKPAMTGESQACTRAHRLLATGDRLRSDQPAIPLITATQMPLFGPVFFAPDQSTAITVGSATRKRYRSTHACRGGAGGARPDQGLQPGARGRRHRRGRAHGRAGRAARPQRRGQDHDAVHDPGRRRSRRGLDHRVRVRSRASSQPRPRSASGSPRATCRSPSACACTSTCSSTAGSTGSPIPSPDPGGSRALPDLASRRAPWERSCRRGSER